MVKKLNLILVQKTLIEKDFSIFSPQEFARIFDVSPSAAQKFIHSYTDKKFFIKLRNGLYSLEGKTPPVFFIANKLYRPSYISLETALSHYGIIPEVVYSVTSVTPNPTAEFDVLDKVYTYTRIKQKAFGGYMTKKENDRTYLIAEPEKALADYLYLISLGKKTWNDRFYTKGISKEKVRAFGELFERKNLLELIDRL
jgi:predicted transcriptional regulator of viral defense system